MSKKRLIALFAFAVYCIAMLWLLFGQRISYKPASGTYWEQVFSNCNFIPFKTTVEFVDILVGSDSQSDVRHAFINLAGNVIMFVPLGLLLPLIFDKLRCIKSFLLAVVASIAAVEVIQLFTLLGLFDVDDLIFNVLGALTGFAMLRAITATARRKMHKNKIM